MDTTIIVSNQSELRKAFIELEDKGYAFEMLDAGYDIRGGAIVMMRDEDSAIIICENGSEGNDYYHTLYDWIRTASRKVIDAYVAIGKCCR